MMNFGANLEQDSEYMMAFSKEPTPSQGAMIGLMVGNSYSTNKVVTEYTLFPQAGKGTRVVAKGFLWAEAAHLICESLTLDLRKINGA